EYEIDLSIKNAAALRRKLAPFSSTMPARRDEEHAAGPADSVKRGAQHGHPGVGERPGHRGQRARAHPRERGCAVRSRDQTTLTGAGPSGAMASFRTSPTGPSWLKLVHTESRSRFGSPRWAANRTFPLAPTKMVQCPSQGLTRISVTLSVCRA